jgi:membrane protein
MRAIKRTLEFARRSFERLKQFKIVRLLHETAVDWYEGNTFTLGAALAYYTVFAIAPLLLIAISVSSLVFGKAAVEGQLVREIGEVVGPTVAQAIQSVLSSAYSSGSSSTATIVGIALLFFASVGLFNQLQFALNTIWRVQPKPDQRLVEIIKKRLLPFVMVLIIAALVLCVLAVHAFQTMLERQVNFSEIPGGATAWNLLNRGVSFVFLTLLLTIIYKVLPDVAILWRDVWVGAAITAVIFQLGNYAIGLYLSWNATATTYGAAGSFAVILLWVYYSSQALLFGAVFTHVYAKRRRE